MSRTFGEDYVDDSAVFLEDFVAAFSKNGEFNSRTAEFSVTELRARAVKLLKCVSSPSLKRDHRHDDG
jgi:hypothetical protein